MAGLAALTYGLIEAPSNGWTSGATIGLLGAAVALLGGFAAWERAAPTADGRVRPVRNMRFTAASLSVTIVFFSLFGSLFLLTQILQHVLGYSTLKAGFGAHAVRGGHRRGVAARRRLAGASGRRSRSPPGCC